MFLLIGWNLYSFINHRTLELLKGECDARRNISVCFLLLSVIYVVSTFFGVAFILLLRQYFPIFSDRFTEHAFFQVNLWIVMRFVIVAAYVFTIMNLIYFQMVFVSMNRLTYLRSIVYFIVTCALTLSQFAFLVWTALDHRPPFIQFTADLSHGNVVCVDIAAMAQDMRRLAFAAPRRRAPPGCRTCKPWDENRPCQHERAWPAVWHRHAR